MSILSLVRALSLPMLGLALAACTSTPDALAARCGHGPSSDCAKAKAKLERQCGLGHADACHALAEIYAAGRGGPKDPAKAKEFFEAACERGLRASCVRAKGGMTAGPAGPTAAAPGPGTAAAPGPGTAAAPGPGTPAAPGPGTPAAPVPGAEVTASKTAAALAPGGAGPAAPAGPAVPAGSAEAAKTAATKPPKRASAGPSRAVLQARCENNDEAACMALGREMIKEEARKHPEAARQLLEQVRQACADGDAEACELLRRGLKGR